MDAFSQRKEVLVVYSKPEVVDYGTVEELTAGVGASVNEDAGTKFHFTGPAR